MSAPTIQTAIHGGRLTITTGLDSYAEAEEYATTLAKTLQRGGFPMNLEVAEVKSVTASVSRERLRAAHISFSTLIGFCVALVIAFAGRAAPRLEPAVRGRSRPGAGVWLRALATAIAIAVVWLMPQVGLPGVDRSEAQAALVWDEAGGLVSVFALGLAPVVSAFVVVELAALAVPRWRWLRIGGPSGRARLARPVAALTIVFALGQGWSLALWLEALGRDPLTASLVGNPVVAEPGYLFRAITALSLTSGALVYIVLASLIDRYGLANGYSIVISVGLLKEMTSLFGLRLGSGVEALAVAAAIAGAVAATSWILRVRVRSGQRALRVPSCGVIPLVAYGVAASALELARTLDVGAFADRFPEGGITEGGALFAWAVASALALSWLFSRPRPMAPGPARVSESAGDGSPGRAFWGAAALSAGYIALLVALDLWLRGVGDVPPLLPVSAAILTAIALDLLGEFRARARRRDLVPVWPLHRVQVVDTVARALRSAGIEVFARGAHHRTMLFFFGPFIPITLMVPKEDAERAEEIVASMLGQNA